MRNIFVLLIAILIAGITVAQPNNDWQLAQQYFNAGEYEKALVYFEKRYDFDPNGTYDGYLKCLIALREYDKGEKLIRKQMKKTDDDAPYYIDLANLYELQMDDAKAKENYLKAIKEVAKNQPAYINLANKFIEKGHVEYAVETYKEGRKNLRGQYPFIFEMAEAYGQMQNADMMIEELLTIPETAPQFIPSLQSILQNKLHNDYDGIIAGKFREGLLRRIQKNPNETTYSELLYWLYLQEKDFDGALMQAKALDKRKDHNGIRVSEIGHMAMSNQQYSTAEEAFQYLVETYSDNKTIYVGARQQQIQSLYLRITSQKNFTQNDLQKLDAAYNGALDELGRNSMTADLMRGHAHLKAFYLNDVNNADSILNQLIVMPALRPEDLAEVKLELGDLLILKDEVWDALLYYGQVDKDFKHDELGREAKFRVARAYYYEGQFEWAAGQLNVLKAATTQLISNDAMSLALLIQDNITVDTNPIPLILYAHAELMAFQNRIPEALVALDSLTKEFPGHSLQDEATFKKAEIAARQGDYDLALKLYNDIVLYHGDDILSDDSQFRIAGIYDNIKQDKQKAMDAYELFLQKYSGSLFVAEARKRFRTLRGDKIN
ncbi:MAG: tetratricopeptide repeat protein [Bacteroidetes bacterium]|nr:tetratricopeptide repeat protein [Bacteroidota bacterium]